MKVSVLAYDGNFDSGLAAVLDVLDKKGKVTKTIPVQFNPSSLRLTLSNSVDGGTSRGRQVQQYNGSSSTQTSG